MQLRPRWTAIAIALCCGCATQASIVKTRFENDYGCSDATVNEVGGGSYDVRGCGERATYSCVMSNGGWNQSTCVREVSLQQRAPRGHASAVGSPALTATQGKAFRRYDANRKLQVVQADFRPTGAMGLQLTGAPQAKLGDILVRLEVLEHKVDAGCATLEAWINDAPVAATNVSTSSRQGKHRIAAHFDFQQFKPLAREFPSFGLKHCSYEVKLSDAEVAELRKFLVMYADIAVEVQGSTPPETGAKPAGTLEL